jgi:hypothetical protein
MPAIGDRWTELHANPFERLADCWVVGSGNILTSVLMHDSGRQ